MVCRPAGSPLLAVAKKSKAVVVVAKLDRLFRSVADAANVIADFDKKGIQLVAIAEGDHFTMEASRCPDLRARCAGKGKDAKDAGSGKSAADSKKNGDAKNAGAKDRSSPK